MTDPILDNIKPEMPTGSTIVIPQQQESVEITRNTKGYNWTLKLIGIDLVRLKETTDALNKLYPNDK